MTATQPSNPLLEAALQYAKWGLPVLPLRPEGKEAILNDWPNQATTDANKIREWWAKTPNANLALLTGTRSGLVVIDSDEKNGKSGYKSICDAGLKMPDTRIVKTPSGGLHYYYQYPNGQSIGSPTGVLDGVDIRGNGGYVVAPPSVIDGKSYTVASQDGIAPLPSQWAGQLTKRRHPPVQGDSGPILDGARNGVLCRFAARMRYFGLSPSEIEAALLTMDDERCEPPVGPEKVATIARWAGKHSIRDYSSLVDLSNFKRPTIKTEGNPSPVSGSKYQLVKTGQLDNRPIEWQVKGLVEYGTLVEVFGQWGTGKTFFLLDLLSCVATGLDFHGRSVTPGSVVYFCGEGQRGLSRRLKAWEIENKIDLNKFPFFISTVPASLCAHGDVADVMAAINATGTKPVHVCFDTRSRNFGPGDPNGIPDMTEFVKACDTLRYRYGATVSAVHHPGHMIKNRSASSFVWHAALDVSYQLGLIKGTRDIVVEANKEPKDFPKPENFGFTLTEIDLGTIDEDNKPITSCVLRPIDEIPTAPPKRPRGKMQRQALSILQQLESQLEPEPVEDGSPFIISNHLISTAEWRDACFDADIKKQTFYDLRASLEEQGFITFVGDNVRSTR